MMSFLKKLGYLRLFLHVPSFIILQELSFGARYAF